MKPIYGRGLWPLPKEGRGLRPPPCFWTHVYIGPTPAHSIKPRIHGKLSKNTILMNSGDPPGNWSSIVEKYNFRPFRRTRGKLSKNLYSGGSTLFQNCKNVGSQTIILQLFYKIMKFPKFRKPFRGGSDREGISGNKIDVAIY